MLVEACEDGIEVAAIPILNGTEVGDRITLEGADAVACDAARVLGHELLGGAEADLDAVLGEGRLIAVRLLVLDGEEHAGVLALCEGVEQGPQQVPHHGVELW